MGAGLTPLNLGPMATHTFPQEDMRSENNAKEIQKQKHLAEQSSKIEGERRRKEEMEDILIEYYQELRVEPPTPTPPYDIIFLVAGRLSKGSQPYWYYR